MEVNRLDYPFTAWLSWSMRLAGVGILGNQESLSMASTVSRPITVELPRHGVLFAESSHSAEFRMAPREDPYHKLIYVLSGVVAYREIATDRVQEVRAGAMLIVPGHTAHQITDREPSTLLLMCFQEAFAERPEDLAELWHILLAVPHRLIGLSRPSQQRLEGMWRRAMFEWEHARVGGATTVRAMAAQTLVLLARLPVELDEASAQSRVQAVREEIAETFYDEWDLDRAAGRAGLSRRRFTDLFRQATGSTFGEHLAELRLSHAAKLLRTGEHSVTGVMFACGFNDVSHFYRRFRQKYGRPPRAWSTEPDNP